MSAGSCPTVILRALLRRRNWLYVPSMTDGDWAEKEAEAIVDRFVSDESSADLLCLQQSIAEALIRTYDEGRGATG